MRADPPFMFSSVTSASSDMVVHAAPQLFSPKDCTQAYVDIRNRDQYFLYLGQFCLDVMSETVYNLIVINIPLTRGSAAEFVGWGINKTSSFLACAAFARLPDCMSG